MHNTLATRSKFHCIVRLPQLGRLQHRKCHPMAIRVGLGSKLRAGVDPSVSKTNLLKTCQARIKSLHQRRLKENRRLTVASLGSLRQPMAEIVDANRRIRPLCRSNDQLFTKASRFRMNVTLSGSEQAMASRRKSVQCLTTLLTSASFLIRWTVRPWVTTLV